jgi:hypothetical protein
MQTKSFDILRTDALGQAVWIEAVGDIDSARARILHLAERFPGEYVVFHQATARIVANFRFKLNKGPSLARVAEDRLSG